VGYIHGSSLLVAKDISYGRSMSSYATISPQVSVVFADVKIPATIVKALKGLVDETLITIDSSGFRLSAMDPARVSMMILEIPASAFLELRVERELSIGVSMQNLELTLEGAKKTDKYVLTSDGEFVEIIVEGLPTRRFIEIPKEVPNIDVKFDVDAIVGLDPFVVAIKDIASIGSYALFKAETEDLLEIYEASNKRGAARLSRSAGSLIDLRIDRPSSCSYEVSYIEKALSLAKLASQLQLSFSSDAPIRMVFPLVMGGTATFYLAPQVS
jgi:proliferating cell nuclear antigen